MRHTAAVYGRSMLAHVRSALEYPADFWILITTGALSQVLQFTFITVLFANTPAVAGWSYHEMLILAGFLSLSTAAAGLFWDGIWSLGSMVLDGGLDYLIVRPSPVISQVASRHLDLHSIGGVTLGMAMVVYGWVGAGIGLAQIPVGLALLACASVIQCALLTALCAVNFWIKGHMPVFAWVAQDLQNDTMRFPLTMYPTAVRQIATWALPFGFATFIPVQILTGRDSPWWLIGTIAAVVVTLVIAVLVSRVGLRSYDSAGS
ncbi:ABC transporter permease [Glycomyces rhizosphaerae]|uniref:ABC transporter permease n=1 Tax=Glycomyces rhizosphaerae TaxID=2054422 RepID=A0ABV7Q3C3_9ACTN